MYNNKKMTAEDLRLRGFSNWENYFWHMLLHARRQQWDLLMEKFEELQTRQQLQCLCYIAFAIAEGGGEGMTALETLKQISPTLKRSA